MGRQGWRERSRLLRPKVGSEDAGKGSARLRHIVVAGGSIAEWRDFDEQHWNERIGTLADVARRSGAQFVTVHPFEPGDALGSDRVGVASPGAASNGPLGRREFTVSQDPPGVAGAVVTVVVDPEVDGRQRICDVVAAMPAERVIDETSLGEALFGAAGEPDLVVILGPPHRLPKSLVWELAYSELVFLPVAWRDLAVDDLLGAVREFAGRSRRFGGVEE